MRPKSAREDGLYGDFSGSVDPWHPRKPGPQTPLGSHKGKFSDLPAATPGAAAPGVAAGRWIEGTAAARSAAPGPCPGPFAGGGEIASALRWRERVEVARPLDLLGRGDFRRPEMSRATPYRDDPVTAVWNLADAAPAFTEVAETCEQLP